MFWESWVKEPVPREQVIVGPLGTAGEWAGPPDARALVVFAHGSGSSRTSPRNRYVAGVLHEQGLATLLFDLLGPDEARERANVFDVDRLTARLVQVLDALRDDDRHGLGAARVGLFGASTGAAAALRAAAERPARVCAVVSRGGRGDLAVPALPRVRAPTLLIVGGADTELLRLNRGVLAALRCPKRLEIVPDATHLFEEPGALDAVAYLSADWFARHADPRPAA
jgi:pimeloyl-ACP methyl ester carboxylesterase